MKLRRIGWCVMVWCAGHYTGYYSFATREEAMDDFEDRRRKFGVLKCWYRIKQLWRLEP